ncbi:MAG: hypothetical protein DLM60_23100 [Pseudonocardiales bacterium]|nr:MAG: hypothetical protein DLM60_23100 [Pseudonocardiales bacterium]
MPRGRDSRFWVRLPLRRADGETGSVYLAGSVAARRRAGAPDGERLVGIEAALSWQHPQPGVLSHAQCEQAAERTGVHDVGQWLLRTAAAQTTSWWQRSPASVPPMVVNLTSSQAQHPELVGGDSSAGARIATMAFVRTTRGPARGALK